MGEKECMGIKNKDKYSGCTVHFVTAKLDSGKIIIKKNKPFRILTKITLIGKLKFLNIERFRKL